ncbi:MAG: hypothetical protein CVV44_23485 [Spirochaetae bacterium HGW-Spirochaetae-1]|jgi:phosphatidylglycerophosphate synthase|nr:MAG: hypothetical protein CVV44_23485 [Spirochaetae bacterium HGW-Spirochaetae-1]
MTTAKLNCNTGVDFNQKICGLTVLERAILSCYYAGSKKIEIIHENDTIIIPESVQKLSDLNLGIKISKEKPYKENNFKKGILSINVSSIINKEYIVKLTGKPTAPNTVYQELTDPSSYKIAEKAILNSCRKPGEAFSSHYYRYLSLFFTKYVCRTTFITPNMVTAFFVLVGLVGSIMLVSDKWYIYYLGLILQPMAIVFDCVDGELARVKYAYSKSGEWLDTVGDNFCTLFFVIAIAYKNYEINQTQASMILGIVSIIIYILNVLFLFLTLSKTTDSGSLQAISKELKKKGLLVEIVTVALKRNLVTLYFMVLGFFYLTGTILVINIIGGIGMLIFSFVTLFKLWKNQEVNW